jgi:hypothetical protein
VLHSGLEQDLEADTYPENRFPPGEPGVNNVIPTGLDQRRHDRLERSDTGNDKSISLEGL